MAVLYIQVYGHVVQDHIHVKKEKGTAMVTLIVLEIYNVAKEIVMEISYHISITIRPCLIVVIILQILVSAHCRV